MAHTDLRSHTEQAVGQILMKVLVGCLIIGIIDMGPQHQGIVPTAIAHLALG